MGISRGILVAVAVVAILTLLLSNNSQIKVQNYIGKAIVVEKPSIISGQDGVLLNSEAEQDLDVADEEPVVLPSEVVEIPDEPQTPEIEEQQELPAEEAKDPESVFKSLFPTDVALKIIKSQKQKPLDALHRRMVEYHGLQKVDG